MYVCRQKWKATIQNGTRILPNSLCDVTKRVHCRTTDGFLVCLEQLEQFKADTHPFPGADKLRATIGNTPDEVDAVLLYFLVSMRERERKKEKS